jgi:hypothetical protein
MNTASILIASHSNRLHKTIRFTSFSLLGSAAFLWLAAAPTNAQIIINPDAPSDHVSVVVNGLSPPIAELKINESQEGALFTIPVPRTIIDLIEPGLPGTGQELISDRLIIEPYEILFQSDPFGTVGTPGRDIPGVVKVPEDFSPISLRFGSDVQDPTNPGSLSDFVDVFVGGSAAPIHFDIFETPSGEPPLPPFIGGPYYFDMLEDDGTLSDTLDIPQFAFSFVSDADDIGLPPIDDPTAVYFRFPELGLDGNGQIFGYDVRAVSDRPDVPEPACIALAASALFGLIGLVRRR